MSNFKGLFITKNQVWKEQLSNRLNDDQIEVTTVSEWKKTFLEQRHFHYIFVDVEAIEDPKKLQVPSTSVLIGLTREHDFEVGRSWLVAGAKDLIIFPEEEHRLNALVKELNNQFMFQKETESGFGSGQVHAFYSAKGGSGKTLLAAMVAQSLSIHHQLKVLVIDLNAQFGNIEVLFGSQPFRSYYDLIPVMEEMDVRHIQNIGHYIEEANLTLVTGPTDPAKAEQIPDELIARLIRIAKSQYDFVILDLPSTINNLSFTGLNEATHVHYVLTPDSLGMRAYKYASELFERFQIGKNGQLSLLVNRVHPKLELTEKDISRILDQEVHGLIHSDFFSIQPNINMGGAFFKKAKDKGSTKVSKDVKKYTDELIKRTKR
ncbi:AAA family ATPase [Robertmurraya andreesenii]|uniref:Pilus assembly protein CpaE n=1 Tax=Anoxybacillus andreesenii TaxID=1325932 RepID=A0ABT9V858_9BACL|nr:AAA family ATPase [Robertmurraya andreesenii]MDQ0157124.1 pilus assembly protein CpaE [Robertmurraya andreesenii]